MNFKSICAAAVLVAAPMAAHAATVTFDGLGGDNGDAYSTYSENGFTVTKTAGDAFVGKLYGNPIPDVFFGPTYGSSSTTLDVTAGGSAFTFTSWDFSDNGGSAAYSIVGYLNNVSIFSLAGMQSLGSFATILSGTGQSFDRVSFTLSSNGTSANFDNFVGDTAAVPEPQAWAMMVMGFMGLGLAVRRNRKLAAA
jgi:hypothetical protein